MSSALKPIFFTCFLFLTMTETGRSQTLQQKKDSFLQAQKAIPTDISPPEVIEWIPDLAHTYENGSVLVGVRLVTKQGFTLYAERVQFKSKSGYFLSKIKTPPTKTQIDPVSGKEIEVYTGGDFILLFSGLEKYQKDEFPLEVTYLGCTKVICLFPYTEHLNLAAYPAEDQNQMPFANIDKKKPLDLANPVSMVQKKDDPGKSSQSLESEMAERVQAGDLPLALLFVLVFIGGLLTNLTPCVYPMIPITIRLLAGQKERPLLGATFYALGIITTYTALGSLAAVSGSMFGNLMASTTFNLVFAALMAILAFTMLGFGNLGFLQNIGTKIGSKHGQRSNAFAMGVGAGLVASPCTGPILAALLTYSASQNDLTKSFLLLFCYSIGFGVPYIFLGATAARLAKVSVGPKIQVLVKIVFAAIMFALSMYYLKIPAYRYIDDLNQQSGFISLCAIIVGGLLTIQLLAKNLMTPNKVLSISTSLVLGVGLFTGTHWLGIKQGAQSYSQLNWLSNESEAFDMAKQTSGPILIDMWAEWCEACKKMDSTTFSDQKVISELKAGSWTLLKLDLTESNETNDEIQERYMVTGLPTLILIDDPEKKDSIRRIAGYIDGPRLLEQIKK